MLTLSRAAELLTSITTKDTPSEPEDSQMTEVPSQGAPPIVISGNLDPEEAELEAREINQYLLAKSFFDCREFDRCAAVFLPDTALNVGLSPASPSASQSGSFAKDSGKGKTPLGKSKAVATFEIPKISQKSLFLALYARFMAGEKRKDEDSEMVMGPNDGGSTINKQLVTITRFLDAWFNERTDKHGEVVGSQGWLEYL